MPNPAWIILVRGITQIANAALQQDQKGSLNTYPDNCTGRSNAILDAAGIPQSAGTPNYGEKGPSQIPADNSIPGSAGDRAAELPSGQVQKIDIPKGSTVPTDTLKQFNPGPNQNPQLPKNENKTPADKNQPSSS